MFIYFVPFAHNMCLDPLICCVMCQTVAATTFISQFSSFILGKREGPKHISHTQYECKYVFEHCYADVRSLLLKMSTPPP